MNIDKKGNRVCRRTTILILGNKIRDFRGRWDRTEVREQSHVLESRLIQVIGLVEYCTEYGRIKKAREVTERIGLTSHLKTLILIQ